MNLPYQSPSSHVALGTVVRGDDPPYIAPPPGQDVNNAIHAAAFYALAVQSAIDDLDGMIDDMSEEQQNVALWVRDYVLAQAEKYATAWHGPYEHDELLDSRANSA